MNDTTKIFPLLYRADVNDSITFYSRNSQDDVRWYFESHKFSPKFMPISTGKILILKEIELENAGFYFCYGLYKRKHMKHFLAKAELKIYGKATANCVIILHNVAI